MLRSVLGRVASRTHVGLGHRGVNLVNVVRFKSTTRDDKPQHQPQHQPQASSSNSHAMLTYVDVGSLIAENARLKTDNDNLRHQINALLGRMDDNKALLQSHEERLLLAQRKSDELQTQYNDLKKENDQLRSEQNSLKLEYNRLQQEYETTTKENNNLKDMIVKLQEGHKSLQDDHKSLKGRFEESVARGNMIDLREAMRSLENYIAMEILGSKTKMRKAGLYTLRQLQQSSEAGKIPLSEKECEWLNYFKEGDNYTHHYHLPAKQALEEAAKEADDNEEDRQAKASLFQRLEKYCATNGVEFGVGPLYKKKAKDLNAEDE